MFPMDVSTKKRIGGGTRIPTCPKESVGSYSRSYNFISNDIWLHISEHVVPEDVQTFALICRQTAAIVKTRKFWNCLLKRYCKKHKVKYVCLPDQLRNKTVKNCDAQTLRCYVIQTLFYCHVPFLNIAKLGYNLDSLIGRSYVSSWHQQCQCIWIMCYKFWNHLTIDKQINTLPDVHDWESLADESFPTAINDGNPFEGVTLLVICCKSYIPFPTHLLYDCQHGEGHTRLVATRELLTKDIRSVNLELDFKNPLQNCVTTVRYPSILKFKVVPWWHPDFRTFIR